MKLDISVSHCKLIKIGINPLFDDICLVLSDNNIHFHFSYINLNQVYIFKKKNKKPLLN